MDFFLSLVPNSWEQYVAATAICMALGWAIKKIPDLLAEKASTFLEDLFAKGGPAEDRLLLAHLLYAEEKFGPGTGAQKAEFLVDRGVALVPMPYRLVANSPKVRARARELLQKLFDRLEGVFRAKIEEHKGVPADSVPPIPGA